MPKRKQLYYDTIFHGLIPVKPVRREKDSYGTQYLVEVTETVGPYKKGEMEYSPARYLVVKTRVSSSGHQYVTTPLDLDQRFEEAEANG